jgi:hypothetical protein
MINNLSANSTLSRTSLYTSSSNLSEPKRALENVKLVSNHSHIPLDSTIKFLQSLTDRLENGSITSSQAKQQIEDLLPGMIVNDFLQKFLDETSSILDKSDDSIESNKESARSIRIKLEMEFNSSKQVNSYSASLELNSYTSNFINISA